MACIQTQSSCSQSFAPLALAQLPPTRIPPDYFLSVIAMGQCGETPPQPRASVHALVSRSLSPPVFGGSCRAWLDTHHDIRQDPIHQDQIELTLGWNPSNDSRVRVVFLSFYSGSRFDLIWGFLYVLKEIVYVQLMYRTAEPPAALIVSIVKSGS